MQSDTNKPEGTRFIPTLVCATTGCVLSVGLDLMCFYQQLDVRVERLWETEPFYLVDPLRVQSEIVWVFSFLACAVLAYGVLDSAKFWRRLLLLVMAGALCVFLSPTLMLWGVLWSPIMMLVAISWTWLCSMVYVSQHMMPCDGVKVHIDELQIKRETIPFPSKKVKHENG